MKSKNKDKYKVLLSIGKIDTKVEAAINSANINIIDYEDNINIIYDVLDIVGTDLLILNRLLDDDSGNILVRIASKAKEKGIKIIIILEEMESSKERKLITRLINENVFSFIRFSEVTKKKIEKNVKKYPSEFDFKVFSKSRIEYRQVQVVKSMFKEVIAVYSPLSQGSSVIASHLAMSIAKTQNCRVCLVDFNPLKPSFKKIFNRSFDNTLVNVFNSLERDTLTNEKLEGFLTTSKEQKNLDILAGFYDINEYYTLANDNAFPVYINQVIEKLKFLYDYVIIDTHSWYDIYTTNEALIKADKVIVPILGNIFDIEEANRYIAFFEKYNDFDIRKFLFVVNRYSGEDLTFIEIEANLKGPVIGYVSEYKVYKTGNAFSNKKIMNEYIPILKSIGLNAEKESSFKDILFNRNRRKRLEIMEEN
ncbi:ParA family protein [Alkaliphilus sp. MSJ-5]|uniref:ParA family protein n=1 Tax=Alkaliphilus flagellatus TaxID=2841507 RepID=A0ABS6G5K6_9FIRM|nr:AAA family ATPase [Alkaliphilus flagellatus]MBU5676903.1 ParA family protein [Alkaliphilus flagellatus]